MMHAAQPNNEDHPVQKIIAISTGHGAMHREHRFGSRWPKTLWALFSRSWIPIPINAFIIEHRDGIVLFDTGLDPAINTDPNYISQWIGRFLLRRIFQLSIAPEDALGNRLKEAGYDPAQVKKVVISHLHFDHVGGIADVPNADLIVSRREWQQLEEPHPEHEWILREHIELPGAKWHPIDFEPTDDPLLAPFGGTYDVMGDGSLILLPTPGHTPGSMSLLVRSNNRPPTLLIGDLTYQIDLLLHDTVPGTGDAKTLRETYTKVKRLWNQLPHLVIAAAHDKNAENALAVANTDVS